MKIQKVNYRVGWIVSGYSDDDDHGAWVCNKTVNARPEYQRAFVYDDKQREAVIDTVMKGHPLNVIYWAKNGDDSYEIIDGQQRTLSICQYVNGDFAYNGKYFDNLTTDQVDKLMDYNLDVYICEGTESEKLEWFRVINTQGERLNEQELRNAVYHGSWLNDAKKKFSARNCPAYNIAKDYMKGTSIRQDYLETVIRWAAYRDSTSIENYMARHQHDDNAGELWGYFVSVMEWVKQVFPPKYYRREMKGVEWGFLFDGYSKMYPNPDDTERRIRDLMMDDDVTNKKGIYSYVLTGDEKYLNIRAFTEQMKREAYERQNGICPVCKELGVDKTWEFEEMEGDHIDPWHDGGKTNADNCKMLCQRHNREKGGI